MPTCPMAAMALAGVETIRPRIHGQTPEARTLSQDSHMAGVRVMAAGHAAPDHHGTRGAAEPEVNPGAAPAAVHVTIQAIARPGSDPTTIGSVIGSLRLRATSRAFYASVPAVLAWVKGVIVSVRGTWPLGENPRSGRGSGVGMGAGRSSISLRASAIARSS